jgi:hypothetical protein
MSCRRLSKALCLGVVSLLISSAAAQAAPGIDLTWGNSAFGVRETRGDLFSEQVRGVAVNDTTGDVYVSDPGKSGKSFGISNENDRIQRFSASGVFISAWGKNVDAVNPSTGYEICTVAENCKAGEAGHLGGELSRPAGITVDQQSGDVYVIDTANNRVQEFSAAGVFIRAFGLDVVQSGQSGDNPAASAKQSLTVTATSGKYTLEFEGQHTTELPAGTSGAEIQAALEALSLIGAGNVEVSGAASPFTIAFKGVLANNPEPAIVAISGPGEPLGSGSALVAAVTAGSSGFEICEAAASCKEGAIGSGAGAFGAFGTTNGTVNGSNAQPGPGSGLAVAPAGAPNAGDVLVGDAGNQRLEEFSSNGQFMRAFGWDAVAAGRDDDTAAPANEFEVCRAAAFDVCKAGSTGSGKGQFATSTPTRVAEDSSGRIYTVEPTGNFRVQRFTLPGDVPTPQGEFAAPVLRGSAGGVKEAKDNTTEVAVDGAGFVYVVKAFPGGTGSPPVETEGPGVAGWQQRILKLNPTSEAWVETMAANPGTVHEEPQFKTFENATGLAVSGTGTPLYVTTAGSDASLYQEHVLVWRLNQITGLGASGVEASEVGASTAKLAATSTPAAIPLGSAYRFEYSADGVSWITAPTPDAQIGNGSAGGESSACSPSLQAATCQVTQKVTGLNPNTTYQLRLVVYSLFDKGQAKTVAGQPFTTTVAAPQVITGAAHWSSPPASGPSLLLDGTVNPGRGRTTYHFEYVDTATYQEDLASGDGFEHAASAPLGPEAEAGNGLEEVSVDQVIAGLDPTRPYHYRLVASNAVETKVGAAREVGPPSDSERYYELVSAGDTGGAGTYGDVIAVGDSGDRAVFLAQSLFGQRSTSSFINGYLSVRGPNGWRVADTSPDASADASSEGQVAADLGARLLLGGSEAQTTHSEAQLSLAQIDGSLQALASLAPLQRTKSGHFNLDAASPDLTHAWFHFAGTGAVSLLGGESLAPTGRSNLYEYSGLGGPNPELAIVNRADGKSGAILGGGCGGSLPSNSHTASIDGSVVFFYAFPKAPAGSCGSGSGTRRLYERIDGERTIEVSKSQCTRVSPPCRAVGTANVSAGSAVLTGLNTTTGAFAQGMSISGSGIPANATIANVISPTELQFSASGTATESGGAVAVVGEANDVDDEFQGASADGHVVFFQTRRALLNSDKDESADLYLYDTEPPAGQPSLVQVSAGEAVPGKHEIGNEAKVLGVFDNSEDGSRDFFVAEGVLTGENAMGRSPAASRPNLYVYERDAAHPNGRIAFIGQLTAGSLSAGDTGEWSTGNGGGGKQSAALPVNGDGSGDGHVLLFVTKSKLLSEDTDSEFDLYRYEDGAGAQALICLSCHGAPGMPAGTGNGSFEVRLQDREVRTLADYAQQMRPASADLSTVVFATAEKLSPEDENETWDAYAWHEGRIELLSKGTEAFGIEFKTNKQVAISPNGKDVFFVTRAALVGADTNNANDLYDARIGGGFPEAVPQSGCGEESSCRGSSPPGLLEPASPGSGTFSGPDNQTPPARCPKGRVRKAGRCVKKHAYGQGKKHHRKRAGHKRGGGR